MKKYFSPAVLVLAAVMVGIAPAASLAQNLPTEIRSNYIVLKGGFYSPNEDFEIDGTHFELDEGWTAEVAYGHYFLPILALELGVGYMETDAISPAVAGEAEFWVVPITLTGKVFLPLGSIIEPYGEFGIGGYLADADVSGSIRDFSGSTRGAFGLHAGAGVNVNITPTVFLGAEGRYLWAKPSWGGDDIKLDGFTVTGNVGYRF